jgi:hypothetical protein
MSGRTMSERSRIQDPAFAGVFGVLDIGIIIPSAESIFNCEPFSGIFLIIFP